LRRGYFSSLRERGGAMPVYLFTFHAYQSWMPDRARGFVQKGKGIQPANKSMAEAYRNAAKHEPFEFDALTQCRLIWKARAVCSGDGYRLHGAATELTHLHAVVSWFDETLIFSKVRGRIKNLMSLDLSRRAGVTGRPWFAEASSRRRVEKSQHLRHLLDAYLPKHDGAGWYEDRGWVNLPVGVDPEGWE
jgi:hypothetical protein